MKTTVLFGALFLLIDAQGFAEQAAAHTPQKPLVNNQSTSINPKVQTEYCNYKIPVDTSHIDPAVILKWAEHAVIQSFQFSPAELESQLHALKSCYTDKGWIGFNSALQKSGNLNAIQTQNLSVSSRIDGRIQLIDAQENQWKILVPIKVIYQNKQDSVTHFLSVYLTVTWRNTEGLGIMQMISMPHSPPIVNKSRTLEETAQFVYSLINRHGVDTIEGIQNRSSTFIASLFPITTRTTTPYADNSTSQAIKGAGLTQKDHALDAGQHDSLTAQLSHPAKDHDTPQTWHQGSQAKHQHGPIINKDYYTFVETKNQIHYILKSSIKEAITQAIDFKTQSIQNIQKVSGLFTAAQSPFLESNKTQQLHITSSMNGQPRLIEVRENQWKFTMPLQVAYQSDKGQVTQLLNVDFTLDRDSLNSLKLAQSNTMPSADSALASPSGSSKVIVNNNVTAQIHIPANQQSTPKTSTVSNELQIPESSINCDFKIPDVATKIAPEYVLIWAKHAITQSFNFNSLSLDSQLQKLQSCYTEQGWLEFRTALQKSGNLEAIRSLNINMNSEAVGSPQLILSKDERWVITLPIKVAYQNNQSTISQLLDIKLTIGRKSSGDLGIIHMLATITGASRTEATN